MQDLGINIYGCNNTVNFKNIANLFFPKTIDACFEHDGFGQVIGIKNDDGEWNLAGHKSRIIEVGDNALELFAALYDETGIPALQARLPALHSEQLLQVLEKFARQPKCLGDLRGEYYSLEMWHETNSQQDGTIKRQTQFPDSVTQWILSGPHFFVGTPLHQTPRKVCETHKAYSKLDLASLPDDYLPRTNYLPACDSTEYQRRIPRVSWIEEGETEVKPVTEYFRLNCRAMISIGAEKGLVSTISPKYSAHINGVRSYVFKNTKYLLVFSAFCFSLLWDFFVKLSGRNNLHQMLDDFPLIENSLYEKELILRALGYSA